eukprot:TRINITY_DN16945_c0_g2_i1.p1 TRINITY_DN16945_c0_g2~~TRINITY_DN16945_c0_g2_i1.p1  ORF type:complete len:240 (+),score=-15.09 TRINITY_DN16945_c0_g2_i1:347-1066(+)
MFYYTIISTILSLGQKSIKLTSTGNFFAFQNNYFIQKYIFASMYSDFFYLYNMLSKFHYAYHSTYFIKIKCILSIFYNDCYDCYSTFSDCSRVRENQFNINFLCKPQTKSFSFPVLKLTKLDKRQNLIEFVVYKIEQPFLPCVCKSQRQQLLQIQLQLQILVTSSTLLQGLVRWKIRACTGNASADKQPLLVSKQAPAQQRIQQIQLFSNNSTLQMQYTKTKTSTVATYLINLHRTQLE